VGRQRKRDRAARAAATSGSGGLPTAAGARETVGRPPGGPAARDLTDPQWRKQERHRILLLSLLPGPPQRLARSGRAGLTAVLALQMAIVTALGLLLARATTGQWLPSYAAVLVLGIAVAVQYGSRAVNSRARS
jgi:hypothetical protein